MTVLQALGAHFIADCLQPLHVAQEKRKTWQVMCMHSLASCGLMALGGCSTIQFLLASVSHFILDTVKGRLKWHSSLWLDQILHVVCIYLIFTFVK